MALENLTITAKTTSGEEITLPRPMWIKLVGSVAEPAGSLTLTYPPETQFEELSRITLTGDLTFFGVVDSIQREQTANGKLVTLNCRTIAALLLDNHATPAEYISPTPEEILNTYCFMMGFKGFLYNSFYQIPSISATRGTSCWDAVEAYCEQSFGRPPHITEDNYISSLPYGDSVIHTFGGDGYPIFELKRIIDRTKPISTVSIRDANGAYSISLGNSNCPSGIRRHRYIIPEAPWLNFRELLGRRTMRRSMSGYRAIQIKTPTAFDIKIGDRAVIANDNDPTVWRVAKFTLTADENGIQTDITLHDSEFFE